MQSPYAIRIAQEIVIPNDPEARVMDANCIIVHNNGHERPQPVYELCIRAEATWDMNHTRGK